MHFAGRWRLRAGYSLLDLDTETGSLLEQSMAGIPQAAFNQPDGQSPQQQVTLQSFLDLPHDLEFDVKFRFVDELSGIGIEDYANVDVRLAWRPRENLELAIVGQNLLEEQHAEFTQAFVSADGIEVERGVYGKVTWEF